MAALNIASAFIDRTAEEGYSVAPWNERARPRLRTDQTGGRLSILDYRCPIGFAPPRHIHREDDEILLIQEGRLVVWVDGRTFVAGANDLVFLPRGVPHAWKAVGPDEPYLQVITAPGQFEPWLALIADRSLQREDIAGLTQAASEAGMELTGPPLTEEEVATILDGHT